MVTHRVISDFRINTHQLKNLQSDFNPKFIEKKSPSSQDKKSKFGRIQKEIHSQITKSPKSQTVELTGYIIKPSPKRVVVPKASRVFPESIAGGLVKKNQEELVTVRKNSTANNNNNELEAKENQLKHLFEETDSQELVVTEEPEQKTEFFREVPPVKNMQLSETTVKAEMKVDVCPQLLENIQILEPSTEENLEIKKEFFQDPLLDDFKEVQNENSSSKSLDEEVDLDESLESPDFEIHDPSIIELIENVTVELDQQHSSSKNKEEAASADAVHIEIKSETEVEPQYKKELISEDNTDVINRIDFESRVDGMDLENVSNIDDSQSAKDSTDKSSVKSQIIYLVDDDLLMECERNTGCSELFVDTEIISQSDDESSIDLEKLLLVEKSPECSDESSIVFEMDCQVDDKPSIEIKNISEVKPEDMRDLSNDCSIEVDMISNVNDKVAMDFLNISEENKSPGSKDSANGSSIDTEIVSVKTGELFWAKIGTYPYWPCMISPDPDKKTISYTEKSATKSHIIHHVRFFADNGRRSWVREDKLMPYSGREAFVQRFSALPKDHRNYKTNYKLYKKTLNNKTWNLAIAEADSLRPYPLKERAQKFDTILEISR